MATHTILRLGHQGDGIADGPVFAPRTLPSEVVTGRLEGSQLTEIRIDTPSPDRVRAPCAHYRACGGCQLQHALDDFVADWKQEIVRTALTAQGVEASFRPTKTSPVGSRRRATFAARRTKKGSTVGFHARGSDQIVDIPDCLILDPKLKAGLGLAAEFAVLGASRKAPLSVTVTLSKPGLDVSVTGGKPLDGRLRIGLAKLADEGALARLAWDGEVVAMRQPPAQTFGSAQVMPPPGAFLQATQDGEDALRSAVLEITAGANRVVDLFAGCGTFSLPLAERAEVHAVEGDNQMTSALDAGWRFAKGLKKITTEARDLFRRPLLSEELAQFEAAVLDPPRAGAAAQVGQLAEAAVPAIAYVSCNPVTFAREAQTLFAAGFRLEWVQVVDQFRWSAHVELAARFVR